MPDEQPTPPEDKTKGVAQDATLTATDARFYERALELALLSGLGDSSDEDVVKRATKFLHFLTTGQSASFDLNDEFDPESITLSVAIGLVKAPPDHPHTFPTSTTRSPSALRAVA